jgi:hypothetical protein
MEIDERCAIAKDGIVCKMKFKTLRLKEPIR